MDPLRVGIIGAGGHAQSHFAMVASEPEMDLVAVAELDPDRLAKAQQQHSPQSGFSDYREMLDTCNLDVVYVENEVVELPGSAEVLICLVALAVDLVQELDECRDRVHWNRRTPPALCGSSAVPCLRNLWSLDVIPYGGRPTFDGR